MSRLLVLVLCLWCGVAGAATPTPFRAEFAVYRGSMRVATTTFHLDRAPEGVWRWESETKAAGLVALLRADHIIETSLFRLTPQGLETLQYGYLHRGSDKDRDQAVVYDWDKRLARGTVRGKPFEVAVPVGTLDRMGVQLAAGLDLARGALPAGYTVLDRRELKPFVLVDKGPRTIDTGSGKFETVLLERHSEDGKKVTAIWYAPSLAWAPVRFEQRDADDPVIAMELEKFERR
jgi:hypothetical protein